MPKGKSGEYSPKQKKIAAMAGDPKVLEGEDFKTLRKKKKLKGGGIYKMKDGGLFGGKIKTKGVGAATQGIHHKP
jgi:hypothetical protein